ncbi:MAG TPA: PP2C family protein-serine/threonine phosphatase [Thermoanaerobaculia bacterium]|nr:PP2C family protein-serine/threonine phosphatase [Thermoanaerobaculia bacterium]
MRTYTIEELALLPEEKAVERFFDSRNYRLSRWLFAGAAVTTLITNFAVADEGRVVSMLLSFVNLVLLALIALFRRHPFLEENFRPALITWLLVAYALFLFTFDLWGTTLALSAFVLPFVLMLLRLRPSQRLALTATIAITGIWTGAGLQSQEEGSTAPLIVMIVMFNAIFTSIGHHLTARARTEFVLGWRSVASRERERVRMREELADARKIQLAMLPAASPAVDWIDIATVSLPATEVGGDFFDFFELGEGRLAIVIGDVAGHGVASGLVLAGIKSGLFLLQEELQRPIIAMEKLNRLVRDWVRWRMLVSLLVAVADPSTRRLRVVSAGSPPLIHYSPAQDSARTVGRGALPLGTRLAIHYSEDEVEMTEGDEILLYTDGASELMSRTGEIFGEERLIQSLRGASSRASAKSLRDRILEDLSHFKADSEQKDDITLVVARIRSLKTAS